MTSVRDHTGEAWSDTRRLGAWEGRAVRGVIVVGLPVLVLAIVAAFVLGRHSAGSGQPPRASLADRINHACRHGYTTQDWQARSAHWITVSCENGRTGDVYVTGIDQ